jgi:hypothetical protein
MPRDDRLDEFMITLPQDEAATLEYFFRARAGVVDAEKRLKDAEVALTAARDCIISRRESYEKARARMQQSFGLGSDLENVAFDALKLGKP